MPRLLLAGLAALAVAGPLAGRPAKAAWGVKAWAGDPSEAPQLPLSSPSDDGGPDIKLPPGYGVAKPTDTEDAGTGANAVPVQGYTAPGGTGFSFGSSLAGAFTCETSTTSCAMAVARAAGAACYCTDAAGSRSWGKAH